MPLKIAPLTIVLGIVASALLYVRSEVDAQTYKQQETDNSSNEHSSSVGRGHLQILESSDAVPLAMKSQKVRSHTSEAL